MIDIFFLVLGVTSAIVLASVIAYDYGQRSAGPYRFYQKRPLTFAQFDPAMSESEMVDFLERAAARIRERGIAESESDGCGVSLRADEESRRAFYSSLLRTGLLWPRGDSGSHHQDGSQK